MSSRLCQLAKGALAPFQVKPQVTPLKDGIDSPLHTLHVDNAPPLVWSAAAPRQSTAQSHSSSGGSARGAADTGRTRATPGDPAGAASRVADTRAATGGRRSEHSPPPRAGSPLDRSFGHRPSWPRGPVAGLSRVDCGACAPNSSAPAYTLRLLHREDDIAPRSPALTASG